MARTLFTGEGVAGLELWYPTSREKRARWGAPRDSLVRQSWSLGSCHGSELEPWQLRGIPASADGFYQQDAGIHATPLNVDVVALICQEHGLRGDDLKIVIDPALVSIGKKLQRFF